MRNHARISRKLQSEFQSRLATHHRGDVTLLMNLFNAQVQPPQGRKNLSQIFREPAHSHRKADG